MTTVRLPWPSRRSSPNASKQGAWRAKATAAKEYKATCAWECRVQNVAWMGLPEVDVTVVFHPPSARRMDLDNAVASVKQGLDAFAEAIGVDDGNWRSMTLERGKPIKGGAVIVTATPVDMSYLEG